MTVVKQASNREQPPVDVVSSAIELNDVVNALGHTKLFPENKQPIKKKKRGIRKPYVKRACINCRHAHTACDSNRPCKRCVTLGLESECVDVERKKPSRKKTASTHRNKIKSCNSVPNEMEGNEDTGNNNEDLVPLYPSVADYIPLIAPANGPSFTMEKDSSTVKSNSTATTSSFAMRADSTASRAIPNDYACKMVAPLDNIQISHPAVSLIHSVTPKIPTNSVSRYVVPAVSNIENESNTVDTFHSLHGLPSEIGTSGAAALSFPQQALSYESCPSLMQITADATVPNNTANCQAFKIPIEENVSSQNVDIDPGTLFIEDLDLANGNPALSSNFNTDVQIQDTLPTGNVNTIEIPQSPAQLFENDKMCSIVDEPFSIIEDCNMGAYNTDNGNTQNEEDMIVDLITKDAHLLNFGTEHTNSLNFGTNGLNSLEMLLNDFFKRANSSQSDLSSITAGNNPSTNICSNKKSSLSIQQLENLLRGIIQIQRNQSEEIRYLKEMITHMHDIVTQLNNSLRISASSRLPQ
jgi:hypothetical protein